ncbi:MAG: Stp1/IreP family PP2C-type Ser/Thr phosphatase [Clostridia bacterium]|nr:Stp1/IreP family PP2C-type Ser/Thr phosphatase [Clostridia bacterium]
MKWTQITEVGRVRKNNEDSVLGKPQLGLFAVADGMGGHNAGEVASTLATLVLEDRVRNSLAQNPDEVLLEAIQEANRRIWQQGQRKLSQKGMGTTITALFLRSQFAAIAQVGDSRAYLYRNQKLRQLTTDHSLVQEMFQGGLISRDEMDSHPNKNILTRALGSDEKVQVDTQIMAYQERDLFLLCSDGLYDMITEEEILQILQTGQELSWMARLMVDLAMEHGGQDNISLIMVKI